ncbi:cytochrome b-c1 complex subunit 6, mitochondrial-like [Neocloeon triangulifer]|uniref:cytochrome b-c1 complex subunit 6, mitochondrial-like n=1 Tax=Neocloeon triangulifer TaxID=2078957 RepID=UPI00286F7099|nr:cytochrome b-c1 complex subunit 6, mitochondrial-like [Neocloeon triangulifer]
MPLFDFLKPVKVAKAQEADEELVDPQTTLRNKCNEQAAVITLKERYEACNDRVNSKSRTTETCIEELNDYLHVLDACVTKTLFSQLK